MIKYLFLLVSASAFSQNIEISVKTSEELDNVQSRQQIRDEEAIKQIPEEIRAKYEKVEKFLPYDDTLFLVIQKNKKGIIDLNGSIIVPADSEFIEAHTYETNTKGKYEVYMIGYSSESFPQRYYSKRGSLIVESYSQYSPSTENGQIIKVGTNDGKIKLLNIPSGKFINSKKYDKAAGFFLNEVLKVERNGNNFLLNQSGLETKIN